MGSELLGEVEIHTHGTVLWYGRLKKLDSRTYGGGMFREINKGWVLLATSLDWGYIPSLSTISRLQQVFFRRYRYRHHVHRMDFGLFHDHLLTRTLTRQVLIYGG